LNCEAGGIKLQVLLREKVDKLGNPGDIVDVASGYARNYLLPCNIAVNVTDENIRRIQKEQEQHMQEMKELQASLGQLKEELEQTSCTVVAQATEDGRLYGSVTPGMVSEALAKKGLEVPEKIIVIEEPIKELGIYEVKVYLAPELEVLTKLWVVEEE
jgi:large subunit ribosomal protein L9